jgi:hypothetical protein
VTLFSLLLTPVFYVLLRLLAKRFEPAPPAAALPLVQRPHDIEA